MNMAKKKEINDEQEKWSETQLKILMAFYPEAKQITLKEIQNKTRLSYEPVYRNLCELAEKGIISSRKFGKTLVYSPNFEKDIVKSAFLLYAMKRARQFSKEYISLFSALKKISEEKSEIIIIFGSYAKGNQRKDSDIDVLAVASKEDAKFLKNEIYALKHSSNKNFSPVIMPKSEFAKIKKENREFWRDLVSYGIIFKGYEPFYHYAYIEE